MNVDAYIVKHNASMLDDWRSIYRHLLLCILTHMMRRSRPAKDAKLAGAKCCKGDLKKRGLAMATPHIYYKTWLADTADMLKLAKKASLSPVEREVVKCIILYLSTCPNEENVWKHYDMTISMSSVINPSNTQNSYLKVRDGAGINRDDGYIVQKIYS